MEFDKTTQDALKLIHEGNHIIFREVGRVCEKYHLNYFLDSGNLIGAVREKSDIPWDDDADIAMTRKDFEVFRKVACTELKDGFVYVEPDELNGAFYDFVPRVVMLDSTMRENNAEQKYYGNGIHNHMRTDIFIVDDVSDNMLKHKFCHALLILVYGMCMGRRYKLDLSEYKGASKVVVAILSVIGRIFPVKTLVHWYDAISKMERGQNKKHKRCYYSNCLFPDLGKIYQAKWFDHAVDLEVDGEKFPGPCGYHEALTMLYGDYMTPPPPGDRELVHCDPKFVTLSYSEKGEKNS